MVSHLGSMIAPVNGALLARRFRGQDHAVGVTCIGDGGTSTGAFHEALNQAAVERLPLVLVVANNHYAYSTPNDRQFACRNLLDRAAGYGVSGHGVDGTDLAACLEVVGTALHKAREGLGPQLIVARLLRLCGHGEHDDASYIDPKLKDSTVGRDCLRVAEKHLLRQPWADRHQVETWRTEAVRLVDDAVAAVQREPAPDPYQEIWCSLASKHLSDFHEPEPAVPMTKRQSQ
jgi:pyruvate dehydrogenase E1 component alpha subunit/2-oxoisovalerate dehydrogenase E1 component alpha subunit